MALSTKLVISFSSSSSSSYWISLYAAKLFVTFLNLFLGALTGINVHDDNENSNKIMGSLGKKLRARSSQANQHW